MKLLYTALFVFVFSVISFSQRIATASASSDFKTVKSGTVETYFTLNEALSETEKNDIIQWADANSPHLKITVSADRKQLTIQVSPDYNVRAVYEKTFVQLNIEEITITSEDKNVTLNKESFFSKIGL